MNIENPTMSMQECWIFYFNSDSEYLVQQMLFQMIGNIRCFDWGWRAQHSCCYRERWGTKNVFPWPELKM